MLAELAALSLRDGDFEGAERYARESLVLAERLRDWAGQVFGVGLLAGVAAAQGDSRRAGRLWGAIESRAAHAPLGGWVRHRDDCYERMRDAAGPDFDAGLAAGRGLELDEAVAEALGTVRDAP
jgi:hypothetical protein